METGFLVVNRNRYISRFFLFLFNLFFSIVEYMHHYHIVPFYLLSLSCTFSLSLSLFHNIALSLSFTPFYLLSLSLSNHFTLNTLAPSCKEPLVTLFASYQWSSLSLFPFSSCSSPRFSISSQTCFLPPLSQSIKRYLPVLSPCP